MWIDFLCYVCLTLNRNIIFKKIKGARAIMQFLGKWSEVILSEAIMTSRKVENKRINKATYRKSQEFCESELFTNFISLYL